MKDEATWKAIEARFGDGQHTSVRSISTEFNVPEATVRSRAKREEWTRDELRERLDFMRSGFEFQMRMLEELLAKRLKHPMPPAGSDSGSDAD